MSNADPASTGTVAKAFAELVLDSRTEPPKVFIAGTTDVLYGCILSERKKVLGTSSVLTVVAFSAGARQAGANLL